MREMTKSRLTSKGQITVPKSVRDRLGLRPGDEIEFVIADGRCQIAKVISDSPFEQWNGFLESLRGFDPDELIEEMRGR